MHVVDLNFIYLIDRRSGKPLCKTFKLRRPLKGVYTKIGQPGWPTQMTNPNDLTGSPKFSDHLAHRFQPKKSDFENTHFRNRPFPG